jgi:hypothetical protein
MVAWFWGCRRWHPLRNSLRPRRAQALVVTCCLFGIASCATFVPDAPQRVDRVPPGRYHVTVSEDRTGTLKYNALLFETAPAAVTLALPAVESAGVARPEDYPAVLQAGFVVYEVRGPSVIAQAYLLVPAQARVTVWNQPKGRGGLVVSVTGLPTTPESAGSGGSGGM